MIQLALSPQLAADLEQVDQVVRERMRSQRGVVRVLGPYVGSSEQLRAALALLAARLGDYRLERVLHAASAVELIHAALSVHARLVAGAAGGEDAKAGGAFDQSVPLMIGDYLFALSAGEMARSPDARVIAFFAHAVQRYCEGELSPVRALAPTALAREQYMARVGDVGGAICEAACKAGMATAGGSPSQIEALGRFGYQLGFAAQIAADARDYAPDGAGASLQRGEITLPLIYAADSDQALSDFVARPASPDQVAAILASVRRHGLAPAWAEARQVAEGSLEHLRPFVDHPVYDELVALARSVVA
jgi:geranylgeranyl pyrophosphate synthase